MGKIALNEWPLSGTQIGTPNVRVWVVSAIGRATALAQIRLFSLAT